MSRSGPGLAEKPKVAPEKAPARLRPPAVQRNGQRMPGDGHGEMDWEKRLERAMRLGAPLPAPTQRRTALPLYRPDQIATKASATIQRTVEVDGDTDKTSLWTNARSYVKSKYGRLKILNAWYGDKTTRKYATYDELAQALDDEYASQKGGGSSGRGRPAFAENIKTWLNKTWGGKRHRRHIVMSSVMREAVYRVTDAYKNNKKYDLGSLYQQLAGLSGIKTIADLDTAESTLVYVLHNNPANLVLDLGDWNSAIGSFAHNTNTLLSKGIDSVWSEYNKSKNAKAFLDKVKMAKGFKIQLQKELVAFWAQYIEKNPPSDKEELQTILEDMYDNAAVDLLSKEEHPAKEIMPYLLQCHAEFVSATTPEELAAVCKNFIGLGVKYKEFSYKDAWS